MKSIIVVTGGSGFVGSNLIELLIKKTKFKIINLELRSLFLSDFKEVTTFISNL